MQQLRIASFGPLRAWLNDRPIELGGSKNRALFGYVAFDPAMDRQRGNLASLLWPEADNERSKQSLRSALYQIRRGIDLAAGGVDLAAGGIVESTRASDSVLRIDHLSVGFQAGVVTSDIETFRQAVARVAAHDHDDVKACGTCFNDLDVAADAYGGEFLADVAVAGGIEFDEWLLLNRESFQNQALRVLDRLVQIHLDRSDYVSAHDRAFEILGLNRYDEFAHRAVMTSLTAQGHLEQASAHYRSLVEIMGNELGIEPSPETLDLAARLRATASNEGAAPGSPRADSSIDVGAPLVIAVASDTPAMSLPLLRNAAFVGRVGELERLVDVLVPVTADASRPPAAVISGIGGVGKTHLAAEFAYRWGEGFPGGVYWINCDDRDNIVNDVAAIGSEGRRGLFSRADGLPLQEQVDLVRNDWRVGPRQLIIFDNCDEESLAAEWLPSQGNVCALFTSRKSDWPLEMPITEVPLRPLERDESVEYLVSLASHVNLNDAGAVAEEVGDHPLALRFAAQFLARFPSLPAQTYVEQLRDAPTVSHASFHEVGSSVSRNNHQQSVERTFGVSMQRLLRGPHTDLAIEALARLTCMAPGVGIDRMFLLESLADLTTATEMIDADRAVQRLLDLGLITTDENRQIVMHRLVHDFSGRAIEDRSVLARARLEIEELVGESIGPDTFAGPEESFTSPVSQIHLAHIVHEALRHRSPHAPMLALALGRSLRQAWETTKALAELNAGLAVAKELGAVGDQGRILVELVVVQFQHGDSGETLRALASDAVAIFESAADSLWLAVALDRLAMGRLLAGDVEGAHESGSRSLELGRSTANTPVVARCLRLVAGIECEARGNFAASRALLNEALALLDPAEDPEAVATTMDYMGTVCSHQGDYAEAIRMHRGAAELCAAKVKRNLALMYVAGALLDDQRGVEALEVLTTSVDGVGTSVQLQSLYDLYSARAHLHVGDLDRSLAAIQHAFELADEFTDPTTTAHRWRIAGIVAAGHNGTIPLRHGTTEAADASTCFRSAIEQFDEIGFTNSRIAATLFEWAQWESDGGDAVLSAELAARGQQMLTVLEATNLLERYEHLL